MFSIEAFDLVRLMSCCFTKKADWYNSLKYDIVKCYGFTADLFMHVLLQVGFVYFLDIIKPALSWFVFFGHQQKLKK
jgi:hypothetical protein